MKHKLTPDIQDTAEPGQRRAAMAVFAKSSTRELTEGLKSAGFETTAAEDLRPPQVGLAMIRGRQGGTGNPFNLGEATVTRAAVKNPDGITGIAYILGRAPGKARLAALADALWQSPEHRGRIEQEILEPVRQRIAAERHTRRRQTAATTVDFFTMVRGDD